MQAESESELVTETIRRTTSELEVAIGISAGTARALTLEKALAEYLEHFKYFQTGTE